MTKQRKVPSGYRIDAEKKKWLQENGGITPLIDRALGEAGYFQEGTRKDAETLEAERIAAHMHNHLKKLLQDCGFRNLDGAAGPDVLTPRGPIKQGDIKP